MSKFAKIAALTLIAATLSACGGASEFERITSRPIEDYCSKARTTEQLVKHPNRSLMGNMREYREEMAARLRSQQDLCAMQSAGTLPPAGSPWPKVVPPRK